MMANIRSDPRKVTVYALQVREESPLSHRNVKRRIATIDKVCSIIKKSPHASVAVTCSLKPEAERFLTTRICLKLSMKAQPSLRNIKDNITKQKTKIKK